MNVNAQHWNCSTRVHLSSLIIISVSISLLFIWEDDEVNGICLFHYLSLLQDNSIDWRNIYELIYETYINLNKFLSHLTGKYFFFTLLIFHLKLMKNIQIQVCSTCIHEAPSFSSHFQIKWRFCSSGFSIFLAQLTWGHSTWPNRQLFPLKTNIICCNWYTTTIFWWF